jgi:hypothetical protein
MPTPTQIADAQMKAARSLSHSRDYIIIHPDDLQSLLFDAAEMGEARGREQALKPKKQAPPKRAIRADKAADDHDL